MIKSILKWTGIALLVVIILAIAAPFIFKDKIIAKVKEEANKNLNAKVDFGTFDLTLISSFPEFNLTVNNVSVANIGEFQGDTLFSAGTLTTSLDLMSVLKGSEYKIRSIVLDHPRIAAIVLKDGKANWDITKPTAETPAQPSEPSTFKMNLKKLEIKNGYIIYDDASLGVKTILEGFNHTLSGDFTENNFTLETLSDIEKFTMAYEGINYINKAKTNIKANMDVDMPNFKFTFKENEIQLNELFLGVDGYFAMPKEDMDMDMKFSAKKTDFKNILSLVPAVYSKDFASVKTSGRLALEGFVKGIYNDNKMPAFGARILIDNGMFQYPSLPKAVKDIMVDVNIDNNTGVPDNTVIDIKKFHIEMADNPVDMKMHISTPVSDPNIDGEIIGRVNLASVKDVIPLEEGDALNGNITADVKMKGKMSSIEKEKYEEFKATGQVIVMDMDYKSKDLPYGVMIDKMYLNFSPQFVELASFDSKIGKSDLQANGKIENFLQYAFKDELLKGVFNIKSSSFNLNELMGSSETTAATSNAAPDTTPLSVVEVPGNIDFALTASIGKLIYSNFDMSNVSGAITVRDKKVDMSQLKMNTMGGSMVVNGSYETKDVKKPKVDFNLDISDFDIPQTFKTFNTVQKLAPIAKYCTGKFSTILSFASNLDTKMEPDLKTLSGHGKLSTEQVIVNGFEPVNKLAEAVKMDKLKRLDLANLNISFKFKDGKVDVEPFDFKTGNIAGNMGGSTGFDQSIDYVMNLEIPRSEFGGQANAALNSLVAQANSKGANFSVGDKVNLDVLFGGTVLKPTVKTSLKNAAGNAMSDLKAKAAEELDKKKKELEDKAKAEADRLKQEAENKLNAEKDKAKAEAERLKKEAEDNAKAEAERLKKEAEEKAKKQAKDKLKKLLPR